MPHVRHDYNIYGWNGQKDVCFGRMLKKSASRGKDGPVSPLCSRNARPQQALVGRAQWGTHPGHPEDTVNERALNNDLWLLATALLDSLFEHPAGEFYTWRLVRLLFSCAPLTAA